MPTRATCCSRRQARTVPDLRMASHGFRRSINSTVPQGADACDGACLQLFGGRTCYLCHKDAHGEADQQSCTFALDLSNAQSAVSPSPASWMYACRVLKWCVHRRSGPTADIVPTMKCRSERTCLLLTDNRMGYLRTRDAERLQACLA